MFASAHLVFLLSLKIFQLPPLVTNMRHAIFKQPVSSVLKPMGLARRLLQEKVTKKLIVDEKMALSMFAPVQAVNGFFTPVKATYVEVATPDAPKKLFSSMIRRSSQSVENWNRDFKVRLLLAHYSKTRENAQACLNDIKEHEIFAQENI